MHRLLIVDDEPKLLDLLRRYLERQGYAVETCGTAEEAVTLFSQDSQRFSMVITDLTLPGMNGAALLERLRNLNPTVPGIIASGYPYEPQLKGVTFLQKPFLPQALLDELGTILPTR